MDQSLTPSADRARGSSNSESSATHNSSPDHGNPADLNTSFFPAKPPADPAGMSWSSLGGMLAALGGLFAAEALNDAPNLAQSARPATAITRQLDDDLRDPSPQTVRRMERLILQSLNPSGDEFERQWAELELSEMDPGAARLIPIAEQALARLDPNAPSWEREAYRNFLDTRRLGIEFPNRIAPENLAEIIDNRTNLMPDGRPLAIFVYPKGDHNGAFYTAPVEFKEMIEAGYRVLYFEAESDTQFIESLRQGTRMGTEAEQQARIIIIGGHGARDVLMLERDSHPLPGNQGSIDFSDEQRFRAENIAAMLAPNGQIILDSCSNGEGRADRDNMANFIRRVFPDAKPQGIWSATESYSIEHFTFDEHGELINVNFHVPEYRAYIEGKIPRPASLEADIRV